MEAYKELFRHKRNEEKRQEAISCFQQIWTNGNIFGRLHNNHIKWNVTPPAEFLPKELAAWTTPPIRVHRLSPSPDPEAEFAARPDFATLVDEFLRSVGETVQPIPAAAVNDAHQEDTPPAYPHSEQDAHIPHDKPMTPQPSTSTEATGEKDSDEAEQSSHVTGQCSPTYTAEEVITQPSLQELHPISISDADGLQKAAEAAKDDLGWNSGKANVNPAKGHRRPSEHSSSNPGHPNRSQLITIHSPLEGKKALQTAKDRAATTGGTYRRVSTNNSRPKKKCAKKLYHPIHRRGALPSTTHASRPADVQPDNRRPTATTRSNQSKDGGISTEVASRSRPTSRPKRKCRFGPRARRLHRECHPNGKSQAAPSPKFPLRHNKPQGTPPASHPDTTPQILPDRVTLQPFCRTTRTPFDKYRKNYTPVPEPETFYIRHTAKRLGLSEKELEDSLTAEINDLLSEIETRRREALDPSGHEKESVSPDIPDDCAPQTNHTGPSETSHFNGRPPNAPNRDHPTSRSKVKCTFGPKVGRGREKGRTFTSPRGAASPPPPPRPQSAVQAPPERTWANQGRSDPEPSGSHLKPDSEEQSILPDRPTFFNFTPARNPSFRRYMRLPEEPPPPPNPFPAHKRLGLSEEAFDALIAAEVDEFLAESAAARQSDQEPTGAPSTSAVPLVPLTKADGLAYFRKHGYPNKDSPGSLWGMYFWAADLGHSRCNFDFDFDKDDLSIFDAYD